MRKKLINRITLKNDGVYVSCKDKNTSDFYRSQKINYLFDAYWRGGQKELDIEIIKLLECGNELRGNHKSIQPYKKIMQDFYMFGKYPQKSKIYNYQTLLLDKNFDEKNVGMSKVELENEIKKLRKSLYSDLADGVEKNRREYKEIDKKIEKQEIEEEIEQ